MDPLQTILLLSNTYDDFLIAVVMTLPRVYGFMGSSQLLSSASLPGISRTAVILCLVIFIAPANYAYAHETGRSIGALALLFAREYVIGVLLGYFVGWIFWVVQTAGTFIDNQRGASVASSIDPLFGAESSPIGDMFSLVFMVYVFTSGAHLQIFVLLFHSFIDWPISRSWPALPPDFPAFILGIFDGSTRLGFEIAAPILSVMFLTEFALAMVSRFAPQIQVFVLAMPIKSMLAIFMLIFYSSILFPYVGRQASLASTYFGRFYVSSGGAASAPGAKTPGGGAP